MIDRTGSDEESRGLLLGREAGPGPTAHLGACVARDGSTGARVRLDLDRAHAGLVVGKRGYGKSYTLGVLAESLVDAPGVVPVVFDPMGVFGGLEELDDVTVVEEPRVRADALPPRAWCDLLDLSREGATGGLVWRAAGETGGLDAMRRFVEDADVDPAARRAALNHLALAENWGVFDSDGIDPDDLDAATVLDCSRLDAAPMNAVARAVAAGCYRARLRGQLSSLPWLLVDEVHALFDGVAAPALRTLLTRGRAPGVSLVAATQRPAALPDVAVSQADLLVAHRLTAQADIDTLARARPAYVEAPLDERLPERAGEAVVLDDATEAVHVVQVRSRETPHGGDGARAT